MQNWKKAGFAALALIGLPAAGILLSHHVPLLAANEECHGLTATSPTPAGYGAAYDVLSSGKPLLLKVLCSPSTSPLFTVGTGLSTQYIYHIGYQFLGGNWQQLRLGGTKKAADPWYEGSARVYIPASLPPGETQYVVAFLCSRVGNAWKCGCRDQSCTQSFWQLQSFVLPPAEGSQSMPDPFALLGDYDQLLLAYPSHHVATPGQKINLFGAAFALAGNTIHFGSTKLSNIAAANKNRIEVTVPQGPPFGVMDLKVQNTKGTSNPTFFVLKRPGSSNPVIESITPPTGRYGTEIVIRGSGLLPKNTLIGMGTPFEVLSADNATIRLRVRPFPDIPELQTGNYPDQNLSIPIFFRVANENGISLEAKKFLLTL